MQSVSQGQLCWDTCTCYSILRHTCRQLASLPSCKVYLRDRSVETTVHATAFWDTLADNLLSYPIAKCISGTDLLRQLYMLLHWDTFADDLISHPVAKCISGTDLLRQLYMLLHWDNTCRQLAISPNCKVYLRDGSVETTVHATALRQHLQTTWYLTQLQSVSQGQICWDKINVHATVFRQHSQTTCYLTQF